jgi:GT2 family glycosyltransferase
VTRAAVVVPTYNRASLLVRTLAALSAQDHRDLVVVVADDGSTEDVESVVDAWSPPFEKLYLRQEHDGFGAGRARNMGAFAVEADVLVLLDSDGITAPDHVAQHVSQHAHGPARVVIGRRVYLVGAEIDPEALERGEVDLGSLRQTPKTDFRGVLSRRTARLRRTDEGYRTFVSSNVSLPHRLFVDLGGFDPRFRWWGSEDTELGWRLWQAGAEFVDYQENVIFHQTDADTAGGDEGRQQAREMNRGLLTSLVPHRFYRKGVSDPHPEIPKFSIVVHDVPPGGPAAIWSDLTGQTEPDFEVLFVADGRDHEPFSGAASGERRIGFVDDLDRAVESSRGEFLLFTSGHAAFRNSLLQNVRRRLEQRPAAAALTFGVATPEGPMGRRRDVGQVQADWGYALPVALAVRRRDLIRRGGAAGLTAISDDALHTRHPLVSLPSATRVARPSQFKFRVNQIPAHEPDAPPRHSGASDERPGIRYVGWVGRDNLGDEAMLDAVVSLMPWGDVSVRGEASDLLLLGGGTLINRNHYLGWLRERDSPRIERAVFGTGVASPSYWGLTEDTKDWIQWLETCCYVGVRGPRSAETLADWGFSGTVEVCGDPALALVPRETDVEEGSVLVAPVWTGGELWGGSDVTVYEAMAEAIEGLVGEGRKVILMSCHPSDDRPIILIRDMIGGSSAVRYLAGYENTAASLDAIAGSSLIVGERLHACVLAAAAGRAFVALEYRPKLRDFAASVDMEEMVIRTDEVTGGMLLERCRDASALDLAAMNRRVSEYRTMLADAANQIRMSVVG